MTRKYKIVFDITELKADRFVNKIISTGDLFCTEDNNTMSHLEEGDQDSNLQNLKDIYKLLEQSPKNVFKDAASSESIDYRYSTIDFLMFSGSNKNQLISKTLGTGIIRLFIKEDENYSEYDEVAKSDGTIMAILAVPSYFSTPDLFGFLGDEGRDKISHFRIFRSENPSRFMVLMKFKSREDALSFQNANNGRVFSSLEPETCQVIDVDEVLFRPIRLNSSLGIISPGSPSSSSQLVDTSLNDKLIELPTCPICLERMDSSITGLVTSSCLHTFHCMCLWKWKGGTCPVCRATSLEERRRLTGRRCSVCSTTNNLWLCLICGNIACGRYDSAHAVHHFKSTNHCYAIDLVSQSVWDYAEDRYVHRLIRNETDGKVVELPSREEQSRKHRHNNDISTSAKNDNELLITLLLNIIQNSNEEYTEVKDEHITKQQELMERVEELEKANDLKHDQEIQKLKESLSGLTNKTIPLLEKKLKSSELLLENYKEKNIDLQTRLDNNSESIKLLEQKLILLQTDTVHNLEKTVSKSEKKVKELQSKNELLRKELEEERNLSTGISNQLERLQEEAKDSSLQEALKAEIKKLKDMIKEKQDENQDLMFYIETLQKFEKDPELKGSNMEIRQK